MFDFSDAFNFSVIFGNLSSRWYYYLALALFLTGLSLFLLIQKQPKRNNLTDTQKLSYISVLTTLSVIANMLTFFIVPNRYAVSFTAIPCFIAGYILGAGAGFAVGFIGDLIAAIIMPAGAYLPLIGIASGLWGFIPGIIFSYFKGKGYIKTIISFLICFVVCSAFLNTLANWLYVVIDRNSTTPFWVYLGIRVWFQAIVCAVNCLICLWLYNYLPRILPKTKFNFENKNAGKPDGEETEN